MLLIAVKCDSQLVVISRLKKILLYKILKEIFQIYRTCPPHLKMTPLLYLVKSENVIFDSSCNCSQRSKLGLFFTSEKFTLAQGWKNVVLTIFLGI